LDRHTNDFEWRVSSDSGVSGSLCTFSSLSNYSSAQRKVLGKGKYGQKRAGLRVKIKELKKLHPNHLAVFESLWGYTLDLDEYQGTIFRFPLRMAVADSKFRLSNPNLSLDKVRKLLASYFETAKVSLLFLRNITSIDFMIYGNDTCEWSVCRQDSKALGWEQTVTILYDQARNEVRGCSGEDIYMVAVEDVEAETKHMPYTSIRAMKRVECGFAAKVSSTIDGKDVQQSTDLPYVFKTLPLPIRSDFNLAVHATFDISGDRRTFVVNDPMNDTVGAVWNRYLLTEQLPKVLLKFLSVLARDIGQDVFKFWPKAETPAASHLSLLIQAFWKQLPASTLALFPAAQPVTSSLRRRHMLEVYSLEQAVFECLPSKESDILAPLLLPLKVRLVKDMPRHVSRQLQKLKEAKFFDGPMLRDLSKTAEFKQRLQSMLIDNRSALDIVLKIAIPRESDQQMALDDCHIIPLLDGTLGTLRFTADSPRAVDYYVATQEVEDLFKFASSLLVSKSDSDKFDRLIKTNGFNLKPLEVNDIQELMRLRLAPNTVSDEEDTWLRNFWKFWNMSQQGASVDVSIDGLGKVLKSRNGNLEQYRQPSELDTLPAIIEPEESNHKAWTCKIPDLVCFDRTILPKSLKNDAISLLASRGSMIRLFKAFRKLSFLAGQSVGGFLKRFLSKEDFIVNTVPLTLMLFVC
jgi:sacsin